MLKKLGVVLLIAAALPVLCIVGFVVANVFLEPSFEPIDPARPPADLAVLAAWSGDDGSVHCRAFYRTDLLRHADSLPELRFGLSESEMDVCTSNVGTFRSTGSWPSAVSWERRAIGVSLSGPDRDHPYRFEVAYPPDEDRIAVTRYEVDPSTGLPGAFEFRGAYGPARGIGILIYGGGGGLVTWLMLTVGYLLRGSALRRGH